MDGRGSPARARFFAPSLSFPVRFEYLIGLRYLRSHGRERFVSIIALISLLGVALGTFALTVTLSVMTGFQEDLRARLLAFTPQITVERSDGRVWQPAALRRRISSMPRVEAVAPFVSSQVMLVAQGAGEGEGYVSGAMMRAVVARNNPVLTDLRRTLEEGSLEDLDTLHPVETIADGHKRSARLPGIILGRTLAFDLGLKMGDTVVVISPASLGGGIGPPRLKRFVVTGLFRSGMYQFDSTLLFVALKYGRALLADDPQLETGLEVRARDLFDAPDLARRIARMAGDAFTVSDWSRANAPLFSALELEKFTYFLVLLLIVLVAAFNIIATLVMVVMERRKEIAILRAMGARRGSIASIFLCQGAALGVGGTTLGVAGGFLTSFLIGRYHLIRLPADLFMLSSVPARLYAVNFLAVAVASVLLCACAALYPAMRARSLSPVEVIRYE